MDTAELCEPGLSQPPKVFNAIDVFAATGKLVIIMVCPVVLFVACVNKAIIGFKAISEYLGVRVDSRLDYRQKCGCRAICDHLDINLPFSLYEPKNNMLALCSASSYPSYAPRAKKTLIDLYLTSFKRTAKLTEFRNPFSGRINYPIDAWAAQSSYRSYFTSLNIHGEISDDLPEFGLRNSRTNHVFVFHCDAIIYRLILSS